VRVTLAGICGADLDFTNNGPELGLSAGTRLGHEFVGVVEAVGKDVRVARVGDRVLSSFCFCDDECPSCRRGIHTSCERGGVFGSPFWGAHAGGEVQGGQAELVRVPLADGTLTVIPMSLSGPEHDAKVLPLGDNFATGYHGALGADVRAGDTVVVIGDGAVGQCAAQAATLFGAGAIVMVGHHDDRLRAATRYGTTHVVNSTDTDALEAIRELTLGRGADAVIDCVGTNTTITQALTVTRPGGSLSLMGIRFLFEPTDPPFAAAFMGNIRIHTGLCPAPAYIPRLLNAVEHGRIDPSVIFTHTLDLAEAPRGYEIMNTREAGSIKVALRPGA
jgi:2-desacetyl-2-hydroxyethyl bacteriochlorophyllide A dehydrogenase